jgi:hypothetical protein
MAQCETFDGFECAMEALVPACRHGYWVIGQGGEATRSL